jgi:glycosyltransferase involved in cell wall biosynthesis
MKVAFFQPYLANWRIEFLNYFTSKSDFEVIVYDGGFSKGSSSKSINGDGECFNIKKLKSLSPVINISNQLYPFYFSPFLFFHLVHDRPDVIVTEGEINFVNNLSIYLYCKMFGKKYIWWSLGKVRTRRKGRVNKFLDPVVDFLLNNSSVIMARNTYAKQYYIDVKGLKDNNIIVAPNSMDGAKAISEVDESLVQDLIKEKKGTTFLYVGGLVKTKRPADLIEAFSVILKTADATLWIVGEGPELKSLKQLVRNLNLGDAVRFFGKVFHGVGSYFEAADVVVVPGLGGLVINHAMIFGKPVISGVADGTEFDLIKDGLTGYLLKEGGVEPLILAMRKIAEIDITESMRPHILDLIDREWNIELMYKRCNDCIKAAHDNV